MKPATHYPRTIALLGVLIVTLIITLPNERFDQEAWLVPPAEWEDRIVSDRYPMVEAVVRYAERREPTREDFVARYGPPDSIEDGEVLIYELGYENGATYFPDALLVTFSGPSNADTVVRADVATAQWRGPEDCVVRPGWVAVPCRGLKRR